MSDEPQPKPDPSAEPTESKRENAAQGGGVDLDAQGDATIGGDVVGRDKKVVEAGTYIEHATFVTPISSSSPSDEAPAPGEPPFKGLQYFDIADADLFFGRELLTAKLAGHLREHHFLAVIVGASGSGKSSVVRAGLIPALNRGEGLADGALPPEGSTHWPVHLITPTAHPLESLAASLTRDAESVTATAILIDDLAKDARSLHLAVRRVLSHSPANRLLLVVDQFEELFTLCRNEAERKAFVDNLLYACAPEMDGPTTVVITLRADFYAHCAQYANLREALAKRQEYIGPMSVEELRRAIEAPARRGGWEFEAGLVDLLLAQVGDEPGALPLLSHALLETWKRRWGRTLTLKGYTESGGVRGAIAKTAETVYEQLPDPQKAIARNIFLRLTELGEGTQDTRRRATLDELIAQSEDKHAVGAVLKTLADARLITIGERAAEVAHEALIREWTTLRRWLNENREGLRIYRDLTEAAHEWVELKRDPGALYRGARLAAAMEWADVKTHADETNALEREFLDASRALQVSELEATKRRAAQLRQRAIYLFAALIVALVAAIAAGLFARQASLTASGNATLAAQNASIASTAQAASTQAVEQRNEAERQARQARLALSSQLAAQAQAVIEQHAQRSLLLAAEALNITLKAGDPVAPAAEKVMSELLPNPVKHTLAGPKDGFVLGTTISPDSHWLATAGGSGRLTDPANAEGFVRVWDLSSPDLPTAAPLILTGTKGALFTVTFSPDGHWLAAGGLGEAHLWDLRSPNLATASVVLPGQGPVDLLGFVTISPDSHWLMTRGWLIGESSMTPTLWDLTAPTPSAKRIALVGHQSSLTASTFSPDSHWLVTSSPDKVILWDLTTPDPSTAPIVLSESGSNFAAFSPDSHWLSTGTAQSTQAILTAILTPTTTVNEDYPVRVWDLTDTDPSVTPLVLRGHEEANYAGAFSSDGRWLVTGSADKTARLWDLKAADPSATVIVFDDHEGEVLYVAFSPDSHWVFTGSNNLPGANVLVGLAISLGPGRLWDLTAPDPSATPIVLNQQEASIRSVGFSPDGHWLATGSQDGTARLWDLTARDPSSAPFVSRDHLDLVSAVVLSSDNHWLVTAAGLNSLTGDPNTRLWDLSTPNLYTASIETLRAEELVDLACRTAGRNLTRMEWDQYLPGQSYRKTCEQWPEGK